MGALSFVIVGHVDHGKSTLIGRLLYDTNSLPADKIAEIKKASDDLGRGTEFAYLLDHLEEERKQGITIDTTQVFFKSKVRDYVIIDAPGHVEFVKNMITGASQAEAAVLIVDAEEGVKEQTKRHSYMLAMLGLKQVVVAINKMDLMDYSQEHYEKIKSDVAEWLASIGVEPVVYLPMSAKDGENIASRSDKMAWADCPTFLESLDSLKNISLANEKSLIFPIQDVYKIDDKRINAGRVEAGVMKKGDKIKILPDGQVTTIRSIEKFLEETDEACSSECVGMTTEDSVFLDRGNVVCIAGNEPVLTDTISANIFWMSKKGVKVGDKMTLRCATQGQPCKIESISKRINSSTLEVIALDSDSIENLEVAEVVIKTKKPIAIKDFNEVQELGRFVLVRDDNTCAGGIVTSI
ncbi:MAG: adenylyl-sulfate kinase [Planctomycetes bacterium]|nr:adenylyl-sulfate kinase [Planctomycetota bacterium]